MSRRNSLSRKVNGILLLDKPVGVSSNNAVQAVKRLYNAQKAGHTGTLDLLASGLLVVCLGEATKVSPYLLAADKTYRAVCQLGVDTLTGDSEGEIVRRRPVKRYSDREIAQVLAKFHGEIEQIPPMHSALKHEGKRLYKLAREGIEVSRKPRKIHIYHIACIERSADRITLDIVCSKGTYVRMLAADIGEALGCGAHVNALKRLAVGPYTEADMVNMDRLTLLAQQRQPAIDELLKPIDSALRDQPEVRLSHDMTFYVKLGQAVLVSRAPSEGFVRLYDDLNAFIGVGVVLDDGRIAPKRLMAC
jgi:tRNA pseudouridine55 synthase